MFKKFSLIFFLALALVAFLVLRPYIFKKVENPLIIDRLPDAEFIGRAYILDVARETSGMLYYHKIPFRDLLSYEFILSQGKQYGLNLQNPIYFFANENGNWGAIIEVSDSSKILEGIDRLRKFTEITDSVHGEQRIFSFPKQGGNLLYGKNYMLIYKGTEFKQVYDRVCKAKRGDASPLWKAFYREKQFKDEKLVISTNWSKLKEKGIRTALFAHDSDSISFRLKSYIKSEKPLNIAMKKDGMSFGSSGNVQRMLNLHLDISKLRKAEDDPLLLLLDKLGRRVGFPTKEFINAWEGDLSFRQGGFQTIKESYVESVLDEDFNVTEVIKEKEVKVPGFSLMLSLNENHQILMKSLFDKGLLRKEEKQLRFLFSPPLNMQKKNNYYFFYSGDYLPKADTLSKNNGVWLHKGTSYEFYVDSMSKFEVFGSVYIPVNRIIRKNRFF
jgi:hypothetical protein